MPSDELTAEQAKQQQEFDEWLKSLPGPNQGVTHFMSIGPKAAKALRKNDPSYKPSEKKVDCT